MCSLFHCCPSPVQYAGIVDALRTGDVKKFREELEVHRAKLLKLGVYLIIEQLEPIVLKRLFKRVYGVCD